MIRLEPALRPLPLSNVNFFAAWTCGLDLNDVRRSEAGTASTEPDAPARTIFTPAGAFATGPTAPIGRKAAVFLTVNERGAAQPRCVHFTDTFEPFGALTTSFTTLTLPAAFDFHVSTASASSVGGFW